MAATRKHIDWTYEPFHDSRTTFAAGWDARTRGAAVESEWQTQVRGVSPRSSRTSRPNSSGASQGELPQHGQQIVGATTSSRPRRTPTALATRQTSQQTLNALGPALPEFFGGSADLTGSNNTNRKDSKSSGPVRNPSGNYLHYGVREFGMAAIMNGIALHGGFIPYGGTFLVFSDYARNGMRMSALMQQRVIYVMTHDSIGLGEDGPTHQPVEHVPSLRIIPNMTVWRPCDALETAIAWVDAIERRNGPSVLALTRQALPAQPRTPEQIANVRRGGYVLKDCAGTPEVDPDRDRFRSGTRGRCREGARTARHARARRVDAKHECVRCAGCRVSRHVLPRDRRAAVSRSKRLRRKRGGAMSARRARSSRCIRSAPQAPAKDLFKHFGFTVDNVVKVVQSIV